jgi:hypothetical protein
VVAVTRRSRLRAWIAERREGPPSWIAVLVIVVLVSAPGYLRQEGAIADARHAASVAQSAARVAQAAADRAEEAIRLLIVQRTEARKDNCNTLHEFAVAHNQLVESHNTFLLFFATRGGSRDIDLDDQPLIDAEIVRNNENIVDVPDCSAERLAAALKQGSP